MSDTCSNCRCFFLVKPGPFDLKETELGKAGECHRFPPTHNIGKFGLTWERNWCAEWLIIVALEKIADNAGEKQT